MDTRSEGLRDPLAAAVIAACIGLAPGQASARPPRVAGDTIVVQNCNDGGAGSLRDAIADVADGGTIDLTALACSVITLNSELVVQQDDLALQGPGSAGLTIDAATHDRVLLHEGGGTLAVDDLTIANGTYRGGSYHGTRGGCVLSDGGSIALHDAVITNCTLTSEFDTTTSIRGGGCVFAGQNVTLTGSRVDGCIATVTADDELDGGGVSAIAVAMVGSVVTGVRAKSGITLGVGVNAPGGFTMKYSTLADNVDTGDAALDYRSQGGGVQANAPIYLLGSTISNNHAYSGGGALFFGDAIDIRNSTIADNTAFHRGGLTILTSATATVQNTTIAFNTSNASEASGLGLYDAAVELQSTIIAKNISGAAERDLSGQGTSSVSGSHNLIPASTLATPPDTLTDDPRLRALHANGGPTETVALYPDSAAIDRGDNPLGLAHDQRGSAFAREAGGGVDIGAYELQEDADAIFWDGFDA
ncbi:MAG TPA: choice-of-anchor Q domain-containing protein [Rhodanobacteraceae bacterium]|nr:choice-of-anchor Q domain-containing protein [Rhodanobacteraceae bacterium]